MNVKMRLSFKDRIGIVADISRTLAENGLNILSMEVIRKNEKAIVYQEIEWKEKTNEVDALVSQLKKTDDLQELHFIDTLPHEDRENRFRIVLNNISDGVLSIDRDGKVTTINRIASQIYNCTPDEIIGRDIRDLELPQYAILDSLEGNNKKNIKQNLITNQSRYQYISTCRSIKDTSGLIVGAVEIAKDMQEIKQTAQTISDLGQISFSDIIGNNPIIKAAIAFAQKIAETDSPVALRGSSGTGKELFARAIHMSSKRSGRFVPINCAALPDALLESELFGYVGGAFTGGKRTGKTGLFETARDGSVFLDEIAEMSLSSQAKLLRLLQEGAVRRIGGTKEIPINARIITATNKNLERLVEEKAFRKDLYYRISVLPIHIPPLSQRLDDIPLLVDHFLFTLASKLGKRKPELAPDAYEKLKNHNWPGNIRELKNVVERAAILCENMNIDFDHILFNHEMEQTSLANSDDILTTNLPLKEQVNTLEKRIVVKALRSGKSIRQTAKMLKISHPALINKMRKHNIKKVSQVKA